MTIRNRLLVVLWITGGVSVTCNALSAEPTPVGRAVAAWPPVALLLVVEVLARSPLPAGRLRWVAAVGAGSVAVVAAVASFHHMHSVALSVGESPLVAWLFPFSVDGLAVVASIALVTADPNPPDDAAADQTSAAERVDPGISLFVPPLGDRSPIPANGNGPLATNPPTRK